MLCDSPPFLPFCVPDPLFFLRMFCCLLFTSFHLPVPAVGRYLVTLSHCCDAAQLLRGAGISVRGGWFGGKGVDCTWEGVSPIIPLLHYHCPPGYGVSAFPKAQQPSKTLTSLSDPSCPCSSLHGAVLSGLWVRGTLKLLTTLQKSAAATALFLPCQDSPPCLCFGPCSLPHSPFVQCSDGF